MTERAAHEVFIVTGGASGIGKATAQMMAAQGHTVLIADRAASAGGAAADDIVASGGSAVFVPTDVTKDADCAALVAAAFDRFGRLDGALNNAGVFAIGKRLGDEDVETFERLISVNLLGVFLCMKHQINAMVAAKSGGSIVNTTSAWGLVGAPNMALYGATKHGVIGLTKSAALEYAGDKIRINAVAPGGTRTGMFDDVKDAPGFLDYVNGLHPLGRIAEPEEVAAAACFLLGGQSTFVTGTTLVVDGGVTAQ